MKCAKTVIPRPCVGNSDDPSPALAIAEMEGKKRWNACEREKSANEVAELGGHDALVDGEARLLGLHLVELVDEVRDGALDDGRHGRVEHGAVRRELGVRGDALEHGADRGRERGPQRDRHLLEDVLARDARRADALDRERALLVQRKELGRQPVRVQRQRPRATCPLQHRAERVKHQHHALRVALLPVVLRAHRLGRQKHAVAVRRRVPPNLRRVNVRCIIIIIP